MNKNKILVKNKEYNHKNEECEHKDEECEQEFEIYNHEDFLIKKLASDYAQEFLNYLDSLYHENNENPVELPSKIIVSKGPTEIITPNFKNLFMDFSYDMKDGSILNYEHYSGVLTEDNLVHAGRYAFEKRDGARRDVITFIISTGDPKKAARVAWLNDVTNFVPFRIIFLKEYSGEEKLKKIKDKINHNKKLTFNEIIDLVLMVLFDNSRPPAEVVEEVCYLTTKLVDATPEERNLLRWGLIVVSNKFVNDPIKLKELRRVITMNNDSIYGVLHDYFQSEKEDYAEDKIQEVIQERDIEIANAMVSEGLPISQISRITNLDVDSIKQLKLGK